MSRYFTFLQYVNSASAKFSSVTLLRISKHTYKRVVVAVEDQKLLFSDGNLVHTPTYNLSVVQYA